MAPRLIALLPLACLVLRAQATGAITGVVTDALSHKPISGAAVEAPNGARDTTAEDGSFAIHDVPSGEIRLRILSGGYRALEERVSLPPGGVQRHDAELHPLARITVSLTDADTGEPLGLTVFLRPMTLNKTGGATITNRAKGETQFVNLDPGDYVLQLAGATTFTMPETKPDTERPQKSYGSAWYPGVSEQAMAGIIHVEESEQRSIDFRIHAQQGFHAQGTIEPPRGYENDEVSLRFQNFQAQQAWSGSPSLRRGFYFESLLPGKYAVAAVIGKPDDWQYASLEFQITDRDLNDLKLSFGPMANLFGSVRMLEDDTPLPKNLVAFVVARNAWERPLAPFRGGPVTVPFTEGQFHAKGFVPTVYDATLRDLPKGYALADVLYGNASIGDLFFPLEGTGQLTFLVTSKPGAITGTIRHSGDQPVPKCFLLLAPDSFSMQSSMFRIAQTESDPTGAFAFHDLAPGKYRLLVLKDQGLNPASIAALMPGGQTVEVRPSATTDVTVDGLLK